MGDLSVHVTIAVNRPRLATVAAYWLSTLNAVPDHRRDVGVGDSLPESMRFEDALPLVLGLLDQVYDLRRQLRRMCDALAAQPDEVQNAIKHTLPPLRGPEVPHD